MNACAQRHSNPISNSVVAAVAAMLVILCCVLFTPVKSWAATPFVPGSASTTVRVVPAPTAKEKTAYDRALKAIMDYKNQPNPIVVDMSDLGLTSAQALHVGYLLHANGELFWVNTFNDASFGAKQFNIPVNYADGAITKMRKELDAAVAKAKTRIAPGMSQAMKVHVLHDYVIDVVDYGKSKKTAYDGLVKGQGDCFGFARTMDLLLRRCGFEVDMAFNNAGDHAWNLVKVGGNWYHVDPTWDNGYTGKKFSREYNWKHSRCHLYLLQSDKSIRFENAEERGGWWAHHKCTSNKYKGMRNNQNRENWEKYCNDYKLYTKGFKVKGLKFKACGTKKVKLVAVASSSKRKAKTLEIPAKIKRKKVKYKVVSIGAGAFAGTGAKTLKVTSTKFSAARVKDSLRGSRVKTIKLVGSAKKKKSAYVKYFKRANSGKSVKVKR